ncbi:MAG: SMI1/KNR4 family protein [Planctomycetes bacterium]|nr:SMI1/KNR4 family protein [Planctomycetota bacterium]
MTTPLASIARVQSMFDEWRILGSRRLRSGTELIGPVDGIENPDWLHIIYRGLTVAEVTAMEGKMACRMPRDLRSFYRRTSGLSLWNGTFEVHGFHPDDDGGRRNARYPADVFVLDREIDELGWKPRHTFAIAENHRQQSVILVSTRRDTPLVSRCDRRTGRVIGTYTSFWQCLANTLAEGAQPALA